VYPLFPEVISESFDLAHVFSGGFVESVSDQHFGVGSNLILPGRGKSRIMIRIRLKVIGGCLGKDMGDGWETRRSRQKGHNDWAIIRLSVLLHL
jgi:allantoicase